MDGCRQSNWRSVIPSRRSSSRIHTGILVPAIHVLPPQTPSIFTIVSFVTRIFAARRSVGIEAGAAADFEEDVRPLPVRIVGATVPLPCRRGVRFSAGFRTFFPMRRADFGGDSGAITEDFMAPIGGSSA